MLKSSSSSSAVIAMREWRTTAALALVRHKQASKRHSGARHAHAIRIYVAYTLIYAYMRVS